MDADRFDALSRAMFDVPSRRGIGRALAGLALAGPMNAFLNPGDLEARKRKKKKKKCKGNTKKCGKKCIPASNCCTNAGCGNGRACIDGACVCLEGFKTCQGACISDESCCTDTDCPHEGVCESGQCVAPFCAGHNECAGTSLQCNVAGASTPCYCVILEGSGDPFCGQIPTSSVPCSSCSGEERCVNLTGCSGEPTGCALACPNPR